MDLWMDSFCIDRPDQQPFELCFYSKFLTLLIFATGGINK